MTTPVQALIASGMPTQQAAIVGGNTLGVVPVGSQAGMTSFSAMNTSLVNNSSINPVVGTFYVAEIFIPVNTTLTGIYLFNGATLAGNVAVALYDTNGNLVANSGPTAQANANYYQPIPFTAPVSVAGPARYFIVVTFSNATATFFAYATGFAKSILITGQTIGVWPTLLAPLPTVFVAIAAPVTATY